MRISDWSSDVCSSDLTLRSESPADMMETLQVNNQNLVSITGDLKKITARIADGQGTIGALLSDSTLAADFRAIVTSLDHRPQFRGRFHIPHKNHKSIEPRRHSGE